MGFYLRKSFRAGPVRLNVSKSGLGASVGVKGLRVGSGPGKRPYIHAGRKGLYYRKSLGSNKQKAISLGSNQADSQGCLYLILIGIAIIAVVYVAKWFIANPTVFYCLCGILFTVLAIKFYKFQKNEKQIAKYKNSLDSIFVTNSTAIENIKLQSLIKIKDKVLKNSKNIKRIRKIEHDVYEALLDKILDDKYVSKVEKYLISKFEDLSNIGDDFKETAKIELFRSLYLEAISDRKITKSEIDTIKNIINGLNMSQDLIKDEISTIREIIRMQKLSLPLPPLKKVPVKIQKSETPYYFAKAKVLTKKKARKSSDSEYEYSIKRNGNMVVTNKRVLVIDNGTTAIQAKNVVDIDVDLDKSYIIISKDNSSNPVIIECDEPLYAGRIIDLVSSVNAMK